MDKSGSDKQGSTVLQKQHVTLFCTYLPVCTVALKVMLCDDKHVTIGKYPPPAAHPPHPLPPPYTCHSCYYSHCSFM